MNVEDCTPEMVICFDPGKGFIRNPNYDGEDTNVSIEIIGPVEPKRSIRPTTWSSDDTRDLAVLQAMCVVSGFVFGMVTGDWRYAWIISVGVPMLGSVGLGAYRGWQDGRL